MKISTLTFSIFHLRQKALMEQSTNLFCLYELYQTILIYLHISFINWSFSSHCINFSTFFSFSFRVYSIYVLYLDVTLDVYIPFLECNQCFYVIPKIRFQYDTMNVLLQNIGTLKSTYDLLQTVQVHALSSYQLYHLWNFVHSHMHINLC